MMPRWLDRKSTRLNSSHTVIYTLSLHDALPILALSLVAGGNYGYDAGTRAASQVVEVEHGLNDAAVARSEEHTSELQSHSDLHSFPTRRSSDLSAQSGGRRQLWLRCWDPGGQPGSRSRAWIE